MPGQALRPSGPPGKRSHGLRQQRACHELRSRDPHVARVQRLQLGDRTQRGFQVIQDELRQRQELGAGLRECNAAGRAMRECPLGVAIVGGADAHPGGFVGIGFAEGGLAVALERRLEQIILDQ